MGTLQTWWTIQSVARRIDLLIGELDDDTRKLNIANRSAFEGIQREREALKREIAALEKNQPDEDSPALKQILEEARDIETRLFKLRKKLHALKKAN
jgi:hypothetical protein